MVVFRIISEKEIGKFKDDLEFLDGITKRFPDL
jgi:hypothetical protein